LALACSPQAGPHLKSACLLLLGQVAKHNDQLAAEVMQQVSALMSLVPLIVICAHMSVVCKLKRLLQCDGVCNGVCDRVCDGIC